MVHLTCRGWCSLKSPKPLEILNSFDGTPNLQRVVLLAEGGVTCRGWCYLQRVVLLAEGGVTTHPIGQKWSVRIYAHFRLSASWLSRKLAISRTYFLTSSEQTLVSRFASTLQYLGFSFLGWYSQFLSVAFLA